MNTIIIRECTHDDIEAIFRLDQDWEAEGVSYTFAYGSREGFIADFERFQEYYFVAEHDGQVIGYINGSVRVNYNQTDILPDQETYLEIENIYLLAEYRDQGVGGELIERLFAIARQNGIQRFIVSTVTKDMDRIIRFYRNHGFKPWNVEFFI